MYPLTGVPQIYEVFHGNISGVSIMAWLGFIIFSVLFLVYGIIHNIKPMVVTNALWVFVDSLVVVGVLVHIMVA